MYASLKEDDPYTIDLARAVFLIEEKEEIARNRIIKEFDGSDIQVLNGRFGPYISDGKLNGKIPRAPQPASLTLEEVQKLLEETGKPVRRGFGAKKAAAKKVAVKKEAAPEDGGQENAREEDGEESHQENRDEEGSDQESGEEFRRQGRCRRRTHRSDLLPPCTPCPSNGPSRKPRK